MELDVQADDYIIPKEPTMGVTNSKTPYIGFTYPKTKKQIHEEYHKLLLTNKKANFPKNYIQGYITTTNDNLKIVNEYAKEHILQNFRYSLTPQDKLISTKSIKKIIKGDFQEKTEEELFQDILKQIKKYVYLKNDAEYNILSIYCMLTYKYLHFDFMPIIHLNGEPGTGKSQISKILLKLSFNPSLTVSTTKSSFFRRIDRKRGLYCIDEKEKLEEHEKELLNGCTYEGNIHTVTEKRDDQLIDTDFHIYTPVILACINDVYGATSTRMIKIETLKPPRKVDKYAVLKINEDRNEWREIRDQLNIWSVKTYKDNNNLLKVSKEYEQLISNRAIDSWKIILNLSKKVGVYENIMDYIKSYYLDQIEELQDGDLNLLFCKYLYGIKKDKQWVRSEDIYMSFSSLVSEKQKEFFTKTRYGKLLRRMGYNIMNGNKKRTCDGIKYYIEKDIVKEYLDDNYEINLELLKPELDREKLLSYTEI